jgi:hypothetical protein
LLVLGAATEAAAQSIAPQPVALVARASVASGRIEGSVRDDNGTAIKGANIVARGLTLAAALSDNRGRFSLALPPGDYVLRASRPGYVSSFRETVRVRSSVPLERHITLLRLTVVDLVNVLPAAAPPAAPVAVNGDDHAHSEIAWRLRHAGRSVLRDASPTSTTGEAGSPEARSVLDWALQGSARATTSFFSQTDFSGQINLLTTSSFQPARGWQFDQGPRGIASVVVGASVGRNGEWRVRGAMAPDALSSWVLLGEYRARSEGTHAWRVGMSYAVQGDLEDDEHRRGTVAVQKRSLGAVHAYDRWRPYDGVELEYGARLDRSDYVDLEEFMSPRITTRAMILPRTFITADASQQILLPGAGEFLPPMSSGFWLPPERTFSTLVPGAAFLAERVRHAETGVGFLLDAEAQRAVSVRRFRQSSLHQMATVFGLSDEAASHFHVGTPGSVEVTGWTVRYEGRLVRRFSGTVDYSLGEAAWHRGRQTRSVRWFAPSASRLGHERLHDLTMSVSAEIPETSTRVLMAYRVSSAFSRDERDLRQPGLGARFDVELRQSLPYRPVRGSALELVVAVRSLSRDLKSPGSIYDELLTVAPPLRVLGGLQVRF